MQRILPSTREWPLFDVAHTREIEARGQASTAVHGLMQRAGEAVARLALAVAPHSRKVWIAAGHGNNGGDGIEAAIHLARSGRQVEVDLLADPAALPGDARASFERATAAGVEIHLQRDPVPLLGGEDIAIDALLGIGTTRPPDGAVALAIRRLNAQGCAVLAVDLPSGLHAATGQPYGRDCVVAHHTLSLLTLKPGLFTGSGRDHAGIVWLAGLGVDVTGEEPGGWLSASIPPASTPRRHAENKGSFGDVIMVGGASGMTGAALLAGRAAHAAGAGRVYVHLLQRGPDTLAHDILRPELMFRGDDLLDNAVSLAKGTVVCGCGGGEAVSEALPRILRGAGRLVLDADALNAVARDAALAAVLRDRAGQGRPSVLTPHPLEAARLLSCSTAEVQADRLQAAAALAKRFACTVVLKGSGSLIAHPEHTTRVNASGNASLASAGTGDVLAGWLGGLWAQRGNTEDGFDAATCAVAQHGAAADPEIAGSLRAGDLIEALHRRQR